MITEAPSVVTARLVAAAATVASTMAASEPLTAGEPTSAIAGLDGGIAVLAEFTGSLRGELVVVVDHELTAALRGSEIGELDVAAALSPTVEAIRAAIGPVVLGPLQTLDARLALHRVLSHTESGAVALSGTVGPRAAIAIGVEPPTAAPASAEMPTASRLDMLRGVEMSATAELGHARMTVNDLLSLRTGAVIELDRAAGAAADLVVNGRLIARGEVVVVDENYGLRITQVITDESDR